MKRPGQLAVEAMGMEYWAKPPQGRGQMVLLATRLDEVIGAEHPVRFLNEILSRLDWAAWEVGDDLTRGQPPIHPRVLASVILYGLLTRIRSSRALEEALSVGLDLRWLVEGRSIDHTTRSTFRKKHPEALQNLFMQIGLVECETHFVISRVAPRPVARRVSKGERKRAADQSPPTSPGWRAFCAPRSSAARGSLADAAGYHRNGSEKTMGDTKCVSHSAWWRASWGM